jgi:predicted RNase H-like HicB family nuclease
MKVKVHFINYDEYWVAEAENGAVSQGLTLSDCRTNIKDAIKLLDEKNEESLSKALEEFDELVEVAG